MRSIDKLKKNKEDRKGNRQGYWEFYYTNGKLREKGYYIDDKREGLWKTYREDGSLSIKGVYLNDKVDGLWEIYDRNGDLIKVL